MILSDLGPTGLWSNFGQNLADADSAKITPTMFTVRTHGVRRNERLRYHFRVCVYIYTQGDILSVHFYALRVRTQCQLRA